MVCLAICHRVIQGKKRVFSRSGGSSSSIYRISSLLTARMAHCHPYPPIQSLPVSCVRFHYSHSIISPLQNICLQIDSGRWRHMHSWLRPGTHWCWLKGLQFRCVYSIISSQCACFRSQRPWKRILVIVVDRVIRYVASIIISCRTSPLTHRALYRSSFLNRFIQRLEV